LGLSKKVMVIDFHFTYGQREFVPEKMIFSGALKHA